VVARVGSLWEAQYKTDDDGSHGGNPMASQLFLASETRTLNSRSSPRLHQFPANGRKRNWPLVGPRGKAGLVGPIEDGPLARWPQEQARLKEARAAMMERTGEIMRFTG